MRFLCAVHHDEDALAALGDAEGRTLTRDSIAYDDELTMSGHMVLAHALKSTREARTVRARGRTVVTDGPFAETKEQLVGFILIEAEDIDEAVAVASRIPLARTGAIEVRPIMEIRQT